jgi:antitoxin component of MazEF toxin-antitoxin module
MALLRKVRRIGGSVAITIPADFAKAMDIAAGDLVEIAPLNAGTLALKKGPSRSG